MFDSTIEFLLFRAPRIGARVRSFERVRRPRVSHTSSHDAEMSRRHENDSHGPTKAGPNATDVHSPRSDFSGSFPDPLFFFQMTSGIINTAKSTSNTMTVHILAVRESEQYLSESQNHPSRTP